MRYQYNNKKEEFIITEILQFSVSAGFQTRNNEFPIYDYNSIDLNRAKKLRNEIKEFLLKYLQEFESTTEDKHIQMIINLSDLISDKYSNILFNSRFRIGISQKIINLFLKYVWAIGKIKMPFHCPIDNIVKNKIERRINDLDLKDWTELDDITDYLEYIQFIKIISQEDKLTIAEWEINNWKRR